MEELTDRVAVITGGGSGIGEAMALAFADAGMDVAIGDIEIAQAERVAEQVRKAGRKALAVRTDVTDAVSVEAFAEQIYAALGSCDVLCNNAGVLVMGAIQDRSLQDWEWVINVNLRGVVHSLAAFVPRMIAAQRGGHIVNTGSSTSLFALPANALYTTTKYAVMGLSESLRFDLADAGIGVSVLCPGGVKTALLRGQRNRPEELGDYKLSRDDVIKNMEGSDAANAEMIDPARVAELVVRAVRSGDFYVITHPGSKQTVARRFDELAAAYDRALERDKRELA